MSREKLLSKLLLSIQAFTYSCCSEAFEARRAFRKGLSSSSEVAKKSQDSSIESVLSRYGISGVVCDGRMVVMPHPSAEEDGGAWPFDGRLGKLRYFGLTVMAAAGAVAADLVQLVLGFPLQTSEADPLGMAVDVPERAPIAYPVLFGNVLTHVVAAMCATCGRARARSDSLDVVWPIPFSSRGSFAFSDLIGNVKTVDSVVEDCEGFLKLGMLARMLQVLLGSLDVSPSRFDNAFAWIAALNKIILSADGISLMDRGWMQSCVKLLEIAVSSQVLDSAASNTTASGNPSLDQLREACTLAAWAAGSFLVDAGTVFQVLVPGGMAKYANSSDLRCETTAASPLSTLEKTLSYFKLEPIDQMLQSQLVQVVVANWFGTACRHAKAEVGPDEASTSLRSRLYRTQGFHVFDWPSAGAIDNADAKRETGDKDFIKTRTTEQQPQDDASSLNVQLESIQSQSRQASTADILRSEASPTLLTFNSKKCVSLLGGFSPDILHSKGSNRPLVMVIPTSYTDLYAELASLMPDCEQTAVCLICGEVLNAGGKGECTRHSNKCGAGAGLFFLLQECSGLIMHKSKAAYIHSPYVDSHGETPQYRGRPLNLDLDRYEHLREVWFSHGVRQKVVAERGSSRQVILPDFY
jgi:Proteolysis_6 C-terminal